MKLRIGSIVKVAEDNDNENYYSFKGRLLWVTRIYTNSSENPFYDDCMSGEKLCEFEDYVNEKENSIRRYELWALCRTC